jgi:RimJ/RimL family protein N-acetyltransferase
MPAIPSLRTERLLLRGWRPDDLQPFVRLNADPEVARYTSGRPMTEDETAAMMAKITENWEARGYGLWAAQRTDGEAGEGDCIGFVGLSHHRWYPDDVEVGWRLDRSTWGQGLATEGAQAVIDHAFGTLGLQRLISVIHLDNVASRRVAEKCGFTPWKETVHYSPTHGADLPIVVYERIRVA